MRVAVLTLTRDRVDYTRHCFVRLSQLAGVEYDHYVLDQGSEDDTVDWLCYTWRPYNPKRWHVVESGHNLGIHKGWNMLLDLAAERRYDVYVTFDNDCELTIDGTLAACCQAVSSGEWVVTPTVLGLNSPLSPGPPEDANGVRVGETPIVGGICRAMPGGFVDGGFRFNEDQPIWGGDETWIAQQFPGRVGWLTDWTVNHYKTTNGQQAELPGYFERKFREIYG